ncbi:MAG TPA: Rne/Rng family ribonuclease [Thermoanaerobaculia bacterium]|jgi:ribonuclease G|nr:Rne/Rng family ribonuclease [Thermoanaerobaculia bacterium]
MTLKMLIESDPHQTRIAVLEDDRLTEIFVERHRHRGLVGNVYKGRVTRVLPGMQAAFVDVGLERDAFLYVSDVAGDVEVMEELDIEEPRNHDDPPAHHGPAPSIDELLKPGQEIIVQVVKDPLPNKGARISTHVTLPGRYLVLLPTVRHFGVSRRIEDEAERERLLGVLGQLSTNGGLIVRTVGEGKGPEEFESDLAYLSRLWDKIRQRAGKVSAPTLLHQDLDLALRIVRDLLRQDFSVLWVDGEETYERIVEFLDQVQSSLVGKVKLFRQGSTLFEQFGIEEQIEAALKSKVWLRSGGYIVINPTEALVAIDVNTGRFVGQSNLEDTVLQTNLEAVQEIVRQIRLRDLGGIIVIDLIDMVEPEHRAEVFASLESELKKDRAKTKMLNISEFGLVEITRKRSRANLERLLTQPCPYCSGRGRIKSLTTICLNLRKELLNQRGRAGQTELLLRVHPEVARALQQEEQAILDELQRSLGVHILLQSDPELHHERFNVVEV